MDVDTRDTTYDRTPRSWPVEKGQGAVVCSTRNRKVDVNAKGAKYGQELLWLAVKGGAMRKAASRYYEVLVWR